MDLYLISLYIVIVIINNLNCYTDSDIIVHNTYNKKLKI